MINGVGGRTIEEAKESMSLSEFNSWVLFRKKFGPLTLHMRVDRAAAVVAQSTRGGKLDAFMPWGKDTKADIPGHVKSPSVAISEYSDDQLAQEGLYRDEKGTIRRKVSNAGKRMVGGRLVGKDDADFNSRVEAAKKMQHVLKSRDSRPNMDSKPATE